MSSTSILNHGFFDIDNNINVHDMEDDDVINLMSNTPASMAESEEEFSVVSEFNINTNNINSSSSSSSSRASKKNGGKVTEEKIFVSVRVRPINDREVAKHDFSVWECYGTEKNTITYTYSNERQRSLTPQSYVFDRVFGAETTCKEVYEEGAKDVALSALKGKNATIFAYGQTSSGKTYTMQSITENAVDDIFTYIKQNDDRIFLLKFSAIEIHNEVTTDLLNPESGPLRLMDDPERGTVIEKLEENIIKDKDHLQSLLAICEAHRQVGETSLNDHSSRSHQIIRLSIESSPRIVADDGPVKSLIAILNFVDLAGSERASFPHSEGTRLKEGCYINRSLLTLSTVIRKLSEPNQGKACHVPYRDSKLTRILQNSLGGNARTAIICTISGSNRHVEQTRNTLFFASCAKEVTNRAQVNMVISDKEVIKQLKREVALLEAKLRISTYSARNSSDLLIVEKDLQIQKMQEEMRKALQQRDLAESRLDGFRKKMEASEKTRALTLSKINIVDLPHLRHSFDDQNFQTPSSNGSLEQDDGPWIKQDKFKQMDGSQSEKLLVKFREKENTSASNILLQEIYKLEHLQNELAQHANQALKAIQKEIECLQLAQSGMNEKVIESVTRLQAEINEIYKSRVTTYVVKDYSIAEDGIVEESTGSISLKDEIQRIVAKQRGKNGESEVNLIDLDKVLVNLHLSVEELGVPKMTAIIGTVPLLIAENETQSSLNSHRSSSDANHHQLETASSKNNFTLNEMIPPLAEENIRSVYAYITDIKERIAKLQYQKQLLAFQVLELERSGINEDESVNLIGITLSPAKWKSDFYMKRKEIFELWDACHVSIIHRSQFYLLFRGDPADAIYIEVELRRLTWLRNHHLKPTRKAGRESHVSSPVLSVRNLKRERESIVKHLKTGMTAEQRDTIYKRWGIPLDAKERKVKLAHLIWTNPENEEHIKMSADLVARLFGLWGTNHGSASKEMFQLSFSPPCLDKSWFDGWTSVAHLFSSY